MTPAEIPSDEARKFLDVTLTNFGKKTTDAPKHVEAPAANTAPKAGPMFSLDIGIVVICFSFI